MRLRPKLIVPALLAPFVLALCVSATSPVHAQLPAETLLRLAESAEVTRPPDELRATLHAETRAATTAAAQAAINRAVAAALERARAVPSARASTGSYWISRTEEPNGWQTSQTLILRSEDAAALLDLVDALQGGGLALVLSELAPKVPRTGRLLRRHAAAR